MADCLTLTLTLTLTPTLSLTLIGVADRHRRRAILAGGADVGLVLEQQLDQRTVALRFGLGLRGRFEGRAGRQVSPVPGSA